MNTFYEHVLFLKEPMPKTGYYKALDPCAKPYYEPHPPRRTGTNYYSSMRFNPPRTKTNYHSSMHFNLVDRRAFTSPWRFISTS